jgi:iron-sulfur cluster assembly protein
MKKYCKRELTLTQPSATDQILTLTPAALEALKKVLQKNPEACLRIGLKRKGCAALSYAMTFIDAPCATDVPITLDSSNRLYIQSNALMFLIGLTMDYIEEEIRAGFVFHNPKEKGRCGCGSSFYI